MSQKPVTALAPADPPQARVRRLARVNVTEAESTDCRLCKKPTKTAFDLLFVEVRLCRKCIKRMKLAGQFLKELGETK